MSRPKTSIEYQQQRGAGWDVVDEALANYDSWMEDDDYDGMAKLHEIVKRMRERRDLYTSEQSQDAKP